MLNIRGRCRTIGWSQEGDARKAWKRLYLVDVCDGRMMALIVLHADFSDSSDSSRDIREIHSRQIRDLPWYRRPDSSRKFVTQLDALSRDARWWFVSLFIGLFTTSLPFLACHTAATSVENPIHAETCVLSRESAILSRYFYRGKAEEWLAPACRKLSRI